MAKGGEGNSSGFEVFVAAGVALSVVFGFILALLFVEPVFGANLKDKQKIVVGVPADRSPVFYVDPNSKDIVGIGVDLMRAVVEEERYEVSFVPTKEPTLKDSLDNEEYDVLMPFGSAVPSTAGKATIVSENLMETPFMLVSESNRELPPINGLRVGMFHSMGAAAETVSRLFPGIRITLYENMDECAKALRRGEVDALLHNSYVWNYLLQKPSYSDLVVHPSAMFAMDFRAGAVDTPQGRAIIKRLNDGIAKLPDTKRKAIILDYTSRKLYQKDFWDYLYEYRAILIVFLVFSLLEIRATRKLYKARKESEEASKAKTMFLANMSHEIRTPINSIMGMGELISREAKDSKILQYAFSINSSANSLLCLVNDILDFSRMEAGKLKLRNDAYHLATLLTDVNMMIKERAESKGLSYDVRIDRKTPEMLIGDETRLKQVMINLLTNGVKYTHTGFVHLIIGFEKAGEDYINLKVCVKDSGIGLKQEEIDRLFKAFERLDEDRNRTVEGTGLGMSIVKQILDAMESELAIRSVYGSGSEFSFIVKQKVASWEKIGRYEYSAERVALKHSSYRPEFVAPDAKLLYVDDTEMNLMVLTGLLEQTKVQMDTAASGAQALELLNKTKYDVLLIDHRMPGMDGVELLSHIKSDSENMNQNTPSIALTANVVEGEREICIRAGFDDYLEKPVNGKRLEAMLRKYLPKEKLKENTLSEKEEGKSEGNAAPENPKDENGSDENAALARLRDEGIINLDDGIEYAGSFDLYVKTLAFFRDSIEKKADEIEELYRSEDIPNYTIKVHALKSTAKVIGAYDLSEKARLLEIAGNEGDMDFIRENHAPTMALYR
ncbi:MAG: response regulator, partial [Lachnospiraceae bacterium]|nr:response regulator [Lachnospiraceae bacterium]